MSFWGLQKGSFSYYNLLENWRFWALRAPELFRMTIRGFSEASKNVNFLIAICWKIEGFELSELLSCLGLQFEDFLRPPKTLIFLSQVYWKLKVSGSPSLRAVWGDISRSLWGLQKYVFSYFYLKIEGFGLSKLQRCLGSQFEEFGMPLKMTIFIPFPHFQRVPHQILPKSSVLTKILGT